MKFLTTSGISHNIENIIIEAKIELKLVTPYLKFTRIWFERLQDAIDRGVRITLVYGKSELNNRQKELINQLDNLELLYLENLHAKCYANENKLVICSMNLHQFSANNNREMGIFVSKRSNLEVFEDAMQEVDSIIKYSDYKKRIIEKIVPKKGIEKIEFEDFLNTLLKYLQVRYPDNEYEIDYNRSSISCENFMYENIFLDLLPFGGYRIDFRLRHTYKIRKRIFDFIYFDKNEIERNCPYDVIRWGTQMKRVKFDIRHEDLDYSKFDEWGNKELQMVLSLIDYGVNQVVERVKKFESQNLKY